ncbi:GTP 3',8-cyclase MoaA [Hylemonella sp. W303a]|uniref:GTP 3',8-cyclase MoaA n=1 Tax=Hylemonella sp. W303a TaxID=3389873 RepID=UPI00396B2981
MTSSSRVIPILDQRTRRSKQIDGSKPVAPGLPRDQLSRPLHDLRISVTDRCNFRCSYCMPKEVFTKDYPYLPHGDLLTFEEISRLARAFVSLGVRKVRLTGGEPLLRKNIEGLIEQLADIRTPQGQPLELTLTTNGTLLARKAASLKAAGLRRATISLDALDDAIFRQMNDMDYPVAGVLEGITAARAAGLGPLKINMVVKRGVNDHEIVPMARHFQREGLTLRFIEYMDVGATNGWRMDEVLPSADVLARLREAAAQGLLPALAPLERAAPGETAERWAYADGSAEVGFISSVTHAFCGDCNRARLSTEGQLYLCLFAHQGHDLRGLLRAGASDEDIAAAISGVWQERTDRYSELRASLPTESPGSMRPRIEMSYIGG